MKKVLLGSVFVVFSFLSIYASSDLEFPIIDLTCHYKGTDNTIEDNRPRTLVTLPVVYQINCNLIFETPGFCHSIILIDANTEEVIYESYVTEFAMQISLPAYLEGEYEIRFYNDRYYYSGYIELAK